MRRKPVKGVLILAAVFAVGTIGAGILGMGAATRAVAQVIPKSLEEGGNDNDVRNRKNLWTVGVAGGYLASKAWVETA